MIFCDNCDITFSLKWRSETGVSRSSYQMPTVYWMVVSSSSPFNNMQFYGYEVGVICTHFCKQNESCKMNMMMKFQILSSIDRWCRHTKLMRIHQSAYHDIQYPPRPQFPPEHTVVNVSAYWCFNILRQTFPFRLERTPLNFYYIFFWMKHLNCWILLRGSLWIHLCFSLFLGLQF